MLATLTQRVGAVAPRSSRAADYSVLQGLLGLGREGAREARLTQVAACRDAMSDDLNGATVGVEALSNELWDVDSDGNVGIGLCTRQPR